MEDTETIHRIYKERTDQEVRAQLKKLLNHEPSSSELANVREDVEGDIEEYRYYDGSHLILCTRWTANGLGYFTADGDEPYATFLHTSV